MWGGFVRTTISAERSGYSQAVINIRRPDAGRWQHRRGIDSWR